VKAGCRLNKTALLTEFRRFNHNGFLILHVAEQNAGLLIRRQHEENQEECVIFEAFEASALSKKVLAAKSALQWSFPGVAVAIPDSEFVVASFQDHLALFLEQASSESVKQFGGHTLKAGSQAFESRETADPSLITGMLMTLLEANGRRVNPKLLLKRVRDDVCWSDGAEKPWRRSPYWLVLRVGIGKYLSTIYGDEIGRVYYKFLFCLVLSQLIDDSLADLSPELLSFLRAKLARRLDKLEVAKNRASPSLRPTYAHMFTTLGPLFRRTLKNVRDHLEAIWKKFKDSIRRPVPPLPRYAKPEHLTLKLTHSESYLREVLSCHQKTESGPCPRQIQFGDLTATTSTFRSFADHYFFLTELEMESEESHSIPQNMTASLGNCCQMIAEKIDTYLTAVGNAYDSNPEQKSVMLLTILELWVTMDRYATELCGLLMDYNPGIPPESLDVLQLPHLKDMRRLQNIQSHLTERYVKSNYSEKSIFTDPTKGCFAERYFDESNDSVILQDLYNAIESAAEISCAEKQIEWQELSAQFESLELKIAQSTCLYTTDEFQQVVHDGRACTKCYLRRKARRMKITIHEHPLPSNPIQAKAVVFELGCPREFIAYRDATWTILGTLARPKMEGKLPRLLLSDYSELRSLMTTRAGGGFTRINNEVFSVNTLQRRWFPG
jgi:hypothetical protein